MTGFAERRSLAGCRTGRAERRAGRRSAIGLRQDKSACADHKQAIGMARCFLHKAVGRAYASGNFPVNSKGFRMRGIMDGFRRRP